ncbi:hypothetical protein K491DRAFT_552903, partial [Lophiostoma macrostomum CBS 122681]
LGALSVLPKEIRQMVYKYTLVITEAVSVKECCGPVATPRELAMCQKHGSGHPNNGRFNVLLVSKQIYDEASWVLHNQGRLRLLISKPLAPYFQGYKQKTRFRLDKSVMDRNMQGMWKSAAMYRDVTLEANVQYDWEDPVTYTGRLVDTVSLLLKGWESLTNQSTTSIPRKVTIQLRSLFNEWLPFNGNVLHNPQRVPVPYLRPNRITNAENLAAESNMNLEKLVSIMVRHRGTTEWTVMAVSDIVEAGTDGARSLENFRQVCHKSGL